MFHAAMKTRLFFRPFSFRKYIVAAVITAFVGLRAGYGSVTNLGAVVFFDGEVSAPSPAVGAVIDSLDLLVLGVVVAVVGTFVSAVAEFVLIDVLRSDEPRLREYAGERIDEGGQLFLFRAAATVVFFASTAAAGVVFGRAPESVVVAAVVAALLFGVAVSLVNGFVTDFVAPIMVVRGCSLVHGFGVLRRLLVEKPSVFAGYAVARVAANVLVGFGATVAAALVAGFFALPLAVLSYALGLTAEGFDALLASTAGVVLLGVVVVVYLALVLASLAVLVQLPVRLFFRAWSLYFLGEVDDEFVLLDEPDSGEALEPLSTYTSKT